MTSTLRFALALAFVAGCRGEDGQDPTGTTTPGGTGSTEPVAVDLGPLLDPSHEGVPVELEKSNHVSITVSSPVGDLRFFVDSGASTTVLTQQTAAALGISGAQGVPVTATGLKVGSYAIAPTTTVILNLDATNSSLQASGVTPIDGILGAPFLNGHQAVLSYPDATLFLTDSAPPSLAGEIGDALDGAGYDTVDAVVNLVQFVSFDADIDGSGGLNTIVDSGAGGTLVELDAATRLGLDLQDAAAGAATIGGALDTYTTTVGELTLGGSHVVRDRELLVVDLGSINGQLQQAGLEPIDVLVGGDLLIEQDAVLDYVGERLFLRPE